MQMDQEEITPVKRQADPISNWKILWAKSNPRHPLWKHMLDVAAVSMALPILENSFGWKSLEIAFLAGLHDIGKADSVFQHQIPDFSTELTDNGYQKTGDVRCRHECISARFINKRLIAEGIDGYAADSISRAVAAHHGYWDEVARDVGEQYRKAQDRLYAMLQQVLSIVALPATNPSDLSAFGMRLAGHVVLCDWIASNEQFFGDFRLNAIEDSQVSMTA